MDLQGLKTCFHLQTSPLVLISWMLLFANTFVRVSFCHLAVSRSVLVGLFLEYAYTFPFS